MQGPIERPGSIITQFRQPKIFNYAMIAEGAKLMLWGYFKKLVVAERLALYANAVYGNVDQHSGITLLVATFFYSFQIYADFSGYTDIALGSAKILGINLTNNFSRPYFAVSIKEFWNRWHISFSTWLRDYLFLPLAAFFAGTLKKNSWFGIASDRWIFLAVVNITFIICGVWHGEGLNFLIWGALFGIYQTTANWTSGLNKKLRKSLHISKKSTTNRVFNIVITFLLVSFTWIFFRADNATVAFQIIRKIFSSSGDLFIDYQTITHGLFGIVLLLFIDYLAEKRGAVDLPFKTSNWIKEVIVYAGLAVIIILTGVLDGGQFIYFQF
jgi:D-alanyl-lipoteichoic acid acyltransferase DltB (MBOAT superfamily)